MQRKIAISAGAVLLVGLLLALTHLLNQSLGAPGPRDENSISYWLSKSPSIDPGALPLGSGQYGSAPHVGVIYACGNAARYYNIIQTGARKFGDWLHGSTWSYAQKLNEGVYVHGTVFWPNASSSVTVSNATRTITTNDLPMGDPTGIFPTQSSDPAYEYGTNPNPITAQSFSISVPVDPIVQAAPSCIRFGPDLIALDGTVYYGALDSHGRDEPAYELQDACGGSSGPLGIYHRYMPSSCLPHMQENNALVGYALDGFGVFSPYDQNGNELTTKDLDECHGTTTPIMWDGKEVTMYHYVLTRDFPYSISCFRGVPQYINFSSSRGGPPVRGGAGAWAGGPPPPPSQAAIEACASTTISRPCSISTQSGAVPGTCQMLGGHPELVCIPPVGVTAQ